MKINNDFHIPEAVGLNDKNSSAKVDGAGSFSKLLEQASSSPSVADLQEPGMSPEAASMFQATLTGADQADALASGEYALELIEHLGAMLANTGSDSAGLKPVASALESTSRNLMDMRDNLDAHDPLRGAIDEIGVLSVVTSMKIERGDFGL